MYFTQVNPDAFKQLQLNAGVLLTTFTPATPSVVSSNIIGATSGGVTFNSNVSYTDFGEDIDNVPNNTMQLKRITSYDPTLSGTFKTIDNKLGKKLLAHATMADSSGLYTFTPNTIIDFDGTDSDFSTVWWVGDYSNVNDTSSTAGFIAIELINALNTASFQLKSTDEGKGEFAFEFHGHYDLDEIETVPFNLYIKTGITA